MQKLKLNLFTTLTRAMISAFNLSATKIKIEKQVTQAQINETCHSIIIQYTGRRIGVSPYISGFPNIFTFPYYPRTVKYTVDYPLKNIIVEELIKIFYEDECFYRWDGEEYNMPSEFTAEWKQIELIVFTNTTTTLKLLEDSIKRKWLSSDSRDHPDYDRDCYQEYDDGSPSIWFDNQIGQYCLDDIPLCNIPE